jgi:hypothetical protein
LVETSSKIVAEALRQATNTAFGDYKLLEEAILQEIGLPIGQKSQLLEDLLPSDPYHQANPEALKFFQFLTNSAKHKVLHVTDALGTMACFHPMWRNFDQLYQDVLLTTSNSSSSSNSNSTSTPTAETAIQSMLNLPDLAKIAKEEGSAAIAAYEQKTEEKMSPANKIRVAKHFARVEVMAYIVRMSLISTVFPLVLRDIRDGLFRGVQFGGKSYDYSVASLLRENLVFNTKKEKAIFGFMEPSPEDAQQREVLVAKRATLLSLKSQFQESQGRLARLMAVFEGGTSHNSSAQTP